MVLIPVLKWKFAVIIDGTLHIDEPGMVLQTLKMGTFRAKG